MILEGTLHIVSNATQLQQIRKSNGIITLGKKPYKNASEKLRQFLQHRKHSDPTMGKVVCIK